MTDLWQELIYPGFYIVAAGVDAWGQPIFVKPADVGGAEFVGKMTERAVLLVRNLQCFLAVRCN